METVIFFGSSLAALKTEHCSWIFVLLLVVLSVSERVILIGSKGIMKQYLSIPFRSGTAHYLVCACYKPFLTSMHFKISVKVQRCWYMGPQESEATLSLTTTKNQINTLTKFQKSINKIWSRKKNRPLEMLYTTSIWWKAGGRGERLKISYWAPWVIWIPCAAACWCWTQNLILGRE